MVGRGVKRGVEIGVGSGLGRGIENGVGRGVEKRFRIGIGRGFEKIGEKEGQDLPLLFSRRRRQNILHPKTWPGVLLYGRLLPSSKLSDPRILAKFELKPGRTYFSADLGLGPNNTTE